MVNCFVDQIVRGHLTQFWAARERMTWIVCESEEILLDYLHVSFVHT